MAVTAIMPLVSVGSSSPIIDMASTSGTLVNGNAVQRQMLYDNDRINLGRVELVYKKV